MKRCYKCQKPHLEPNGPGFQDVCEGCMSYLHCCQNCYFFDPYQHNNCTEPQAEYVSDPNGMNRCEYFRFKSERGVGKLDEQNEGRRFKKPDWRNLNKKDEAGRGKRGKAFARPSRPAQDPFGSGGGSGSGPASRDGKAQKAREALDKLFNKE